MAIFGLGAMFNGTDDVLEDFIKKGVACIDWDESEAHPLHKMLAHIKIGDLIFIKSFPPSIGVTIKAVGVVIDDVVQKTELGKGIKVKWVWKGNELLGKIDDKYNVRLNTIFEEYNMNVQAKVIDLLLHPNLL